MDPSPEITLIKDLDITKSTFNLKVKVLRLWTQPDLRNIGEIFSIEMILMDEEGNKIQGNVLRKWFARFQPVLQEGQAFYVLNPTMCENRSKLKFGRGQDKISFYHDTRIHRCTDFTGSIYGFSFADYYDILSTNLPQNISIDIIGDVVTYTPIETIQKDKGNTTKKLTIQLQNLEGTRVFVTLWNKFAQQFSDFLDEHTQQHRVIVIVQFATVNYWRGRATVSTYYDISKVYIGSDIHDINEFKQKFIGNTANTISSERMTVVSSKGYSYEKDFLITTEFSTLNDVMECKEVKTFIVFGTVVGFQHNFQWHYAGCKGCHCKAYQVDGDKDVYECKSSKCQGKVINVVQRYKIPLRVQDYYATVTLTLFDSDANNILGISATELYDKYKQLGDVDVMPKEFDVFLGKRYAFKIEVKQFNLDNNSRVYSITKFTSDEKILSSLLEKLDGQQPTQSDSFNLNISDSASMDDGSKHKDAVSCTGDNATPVDMDKSQTPSTFQDFQKNIGSTDLKRKLDSEFDLDSSTLSSTTKMKKMPIFEQGEGSLLIPKVEK